MGTEQSARFDIKLLTTGESKEQLKKMLQRVRGLSLSPEEIVGSCPCVIATNVSGVAVKKLKFFLGQIGAKVAIRAHEQNPRAPEVQPPTQFRDDHPSVSEAEIVSSGRSGLPQLPAVYPGKVFPGNARTEVHRMPSSGPFIPDAGSSTSIRLKRSVGELTRALNDKDWTVREHAILELGEIPSNGVIRHLTEMLKDDAWRVRCTALSVLGKFGSNAALKEMTKCVQDDVWHVRYQAIEALSHIESDKVLKPIVAALHDSNWQVRQRAVQVLGDIQSSRTLSHMIACLKDEVWHVRESAAEALAKIKSEKSVKPLTEVLQDSNWRVRSMAITALREIGSEGAISALIEVLNDENWIIHWKAAHALGRIGNTSFFPILRWLKKEDHPFLREVSEKALQSIEVIVEPKKQALPRLEYRSENPYQNMTFIPAGEFIMGDDNGHDDAKPAHHVFLPGFFIDTYEVTNLQYKHFDSSHEYPHGMGLYPVVNVTWEEARAYAAWVGKRLPTEAEWEKAARGFHGNLYPWGQEFDPSKCNAEESENRSLTRIDEYPTGKSPFGVWDMFGNMLEWTADRYIPYSVSNYDSPDFQEDFVVLRGSSWIHQGNRANCAARIYAPPKNRSNFIGFRCVKDIE